MTKIAASGWIPFKRRKLFQISQITDRGRRTEESLSSDPTNYRIDGQGRRRKKFAGKEKFSGNANYCQFAAVFLPLHSGDLRRSFFADSPDREEDNEEETMWGWRNWSVSPRFGFKVISPEVGNLVRELAFRNHSELTPSETDSFRLLKDVF